jgi:hypothetical protein
MTAQENTDATLDRSADYGPDDIMVIAAFRYCVGRRTYMVGYGAEWLVRLWPTLAERARFVIQRDLEEDFRRDDQARAEGAEYKPLGMDMDRREWEKVRALWREAGKS